MKHVQGKCDVVKFKLGDELVTKDGFSVSETVLIEHGYVFEDGDFITLKRWNRIEENYAEFHLSKEELKEIAKRFVV